MQREDLIRQCGGRRGDAWWAAERTHTGAVPPAAERRAPGLRAADADRDATADKLRRAHVEGRLDTTELEERLERCYAAKTYGELDEILADLPKPRERERESGGERRRRHGARALRFVPIVAVIVALAITSHAVWLLWWLAIFAFVRSRRRYRRYPRPL